MVLGNHGKGKRLSTFEAFSIIAKQLAFTSSHSTSSVPGDSAGEGTRFCKAPAFLDPPRLIR